MVRQVRHYHQGQHRVALSRTRQVPGRTRWPPLLRCNYSILDISATRRHYFFTYLKVPEGTCAHKHKHKHKHTTPAAPWDQNLTPSMALLPTSLPQTAPSSWCPLGIQECCYCHCTHYPTNTHQPHRLHQLSTLQSHGSPSPSGSHTSALCSSGLPSKLAACSSRSPARSHLQPPMNRL